jgi:hypothetical protein
MKSVSLGIIAFYDIDFIIQLRKSEIIKEG